MRTALIPLVLFSALLGLTVAGAASGRESSEPASLFSPFGELLDRHLLSTETDTGGRLTAFDYEAALADEDTPRLLQQQRQRLSGFDPDGLTTRTAATAFWVNAYNFFMLAHILSERPDGELVETVWDYGGRYNPFRNNVFQRELFEVDGQRYSLDQIEKEILLGEAFRNKGWDDARVHFAVNCASVGCPPLYPTPYSAEALDRQLDENTRLSLLTPRQLRIEDQTLYLSQLFDWYSEDFVQAAGSIRAFIRSYLPPERSEAVDATTDIEFIDYDWSLNRPANFPSFREQ